MEITVSDEMIEKILRECIKNKVDKYLKDVNDPFYFSNLFRNVASEEVRKQVNASTIISVCKEISSDVISDKVTQCLTERIIDALSY